MMEKEEVEEKEQVDIEKERDKMGPKTREVEVKASEHSGTDIQVDPHVIEDTWTIKIVGKRTAKNNNLTTAAPFLNLVIRLHEGKPFIPKGLHRFGSFEESQQWSMRMMTRPGNPARLH